MQNTELLTRESIAELVAGPDSGLTPAWEEYHTAFVFEEEAAIDFALNHPNPEIRQRAQQARAVHLILDVRRQKDNEGFREWFNRRNNGDLLLGLGRAYSYLFPGGENSG